MPIFEAEDSASHLEILLVLVGQRVVDLLDPPVGGDVVALRLRVEVHHDVLAARHRLHHPQQVQQRLVQIDLHRVFGICLLWLSSNSSNTENPFTTAGNYQTIKQQIPSIPDVPASVSCIGVD